MKTFANANARDVQQAVNAGRRTRTRAARRSSFAGGGSDLLGLVKERIVAPDVIVNLHDRSRARPGRRRPPAASTIGGQITLDALSRHAIDHAAVRRAGRSGRQRRHAADPQRRHAGGQRLPAAVVLVFPQRVSRASRPAGISASRSPARTSSTRSSAAARATSCIRRTPRPRWWRSTRRSASSGRAASGGCRRRDSSCCRGRTRSRRTCSATMKCSSRCRCPRRSPARAARITRCWTAKPGRTRSSAPPSCSRWISRSAAARASCSAAWRRFRGGCRRSRSLLTGQRITEELAAKAGEAAVAGARPLSKNAYKIPLTKDMVKRTIFELATQA